MGGVILGYIVRDNVGVYWIFENSTKGKKYAPKKNMKYKHLIPAILCNLKSNKMDINEINVNSPITVIPVKSDDDYMVSEIIKSGLKYSRIIEGYEVYNGGGVVLCHCQTESQAQLICKIPDMLQYCEMFRDVMPEFNLLHKKVKELLNSIRWGKGS